MDTLCELPLAVQHRSQRKTYYSLVIDRVRSLEIDRFRPLTPDHWFGSLQQSPAAGASFAPASSTTFQLPSGSLRHTVMYLPLVTTGFPFASLLCPSKCPHV